MPRVPVRRLFALCLCLSGPAVAEGDAREVAGAMCRDDATDTPPCFQGTTRGAEGRKMRGCAGDPASRITGGEWRVEAVAGEAIVAGATVSIAFSDAGRVTGHSGCNRFTGRYTRTGEGLSFGKLASTMMACPEALMRQERRVLEVLARVTRFDIDETGQLLLIGDKNDHALLTARRP